MHNKSMIIRLYYTALLEDFYDGDPDRYNWDETRSTIISMLTEEGFGKVESPRRDEIILTAMAGDEATMRIKIEAILQRSSLPVPDWIAIDHK